MRSDQGLVVPDSRCFLGPGGRLHVTVVHAGLETGTPALDEEPYNLWQVGLVEE